MKPENRAYKNGKKSAIDAVITSRARHLAVNDLIDSKKESKSDEERQEKLRFIIRKLSDEKVEELVNLVLASEKSNGQISVDIEDAPGNTKSITGDFGDDGHMSLHVIKGSHKKLDSNQEGRQKSTGYGENNIFIKKNTKSDVKDLALKKYESEKKKLSLKEDLEDLLENVIYEEKRIDIPDNIKDVYNEVKDIQYGFISKIDGSRIDDRDWIHNCENLSNYYELNTDPEITLKNKLGICLDQSLAIKYLINKLHPEYKCQIYALTKGRFGHAVPCYSDDSGSWFYFENAWDKELGIHGPFANVKELTNYLNLIYEKNHKNDNDDMVVVQAYEDFLKK